MGEEQQLGGTSQSPRRGPLAGVRVLDITRFLPGPLAAQSLADLGADVIKVELPPSGDMARHMDPQLGFESINRNKRSLCIDLQQEKGRALMAQLVRQSDVLIEVSRPGAMAAFGLDYESVRALRPEMIYCSMSAFGQSGPYRDIPAHGMNIDALSGYLPVTTLADGSAAVSPDHVYLGSLFAAHMATMGICAALYARGQHGQGCFIDASCWDCALASDPVGSASAASHMPMVEGFGSRATPKYAPYPTSDGRHLMVCAIEPKFWRKFCALIGRADLATVFDSPNAQGQMPDMWGQGMSDVYDAVAAQIAQQPLAHWEKIFADSGLPVTPVHNRAEAMASAHAQARDMVQQVTDSRGDAYRMAAYGLMWNGARLPLHNRAPALGADSADIMRSLGYGDSDVAALIADGVLK